MTEKLAHPPLRNASGVFRNFQEFQEFLRILKNFQEFLRIFKNFKNS